MIVVDASALVELLTDQRSRAEQVRDVLASDAEWAVPEHATVEVISALRGLWLGGHCTTSELDARLDALSTLELMRFAVGDLVQRMRPMLHNTTAYDAAYLALADLLQVDLVTLDGKLRDVPGSAANVRLIE